MDLARAEDFCRSYGDAMASGGAAALASHYSEPYVSFTLGYISQFDTREEAVKSVSDHLARFERSGLGLDIRLETFEVTLVSPASALCRLHWTIHPRQGEGWSWENIYGLRQSDGTQAFEFNISDNEIGELLARYPDFMQA